MTPNQSHVAGLELASEAINEYTDPEAMQGAMHRLLNQAKSATAEPVSREAVAKVSVWQIDPWYAEEPSLAGRNIGVVFLGNHAKSLVDGQLLYTAPPSPDAELVELLHNIPGWIGGDWAEAVRAKLASLSAKP